MQYMRVVTIPRPKIEYTRGDITHMEYPAMMGNSTGFQFSVFLVLFCYTSKARRYEGVLRDSVLDSVRAPLSFVVRRCPGWRRRMIV